MSDSETTTEVVAPVEATETTNIELTANTGEVQSAETGGAVESTESDSEQTDSSSTGVPESYADFTMPEGIDVDTSLLDEAIPVFKDLGLDQAGAQKLVDIEAGRAVARVQKQHDDFNQMIDGWKNQSMNDKEFGGDNFNENVAVAQQAIEKFGTPELNQLLSDHGVGNHPEVIRFMVRVGNLTKEKAIEGGGTPASPQQSRLDRLYPQK